MRKGTSRRKALWKAMGHRDQQLGAQITQENAISHSGLTRCKVVPTFRINYSGFLCFDVVPGIIILDVGLDIMPG